MPVFRTIFKAIVRPHLEYAQTVWSPNKKDIRIVENVQRRASKLGLKNISYEERLRRLDLPAMTYRRLRGDMIKVFKILNERYDPEENIPFQRREDPTRGNSLKLFKPQCRTKLRQNLFHLRVINVWNSLPSHVVQSKSIKSFERRLNGRPHNSRFGYQIRRIQ